MSEDFWSYHSGLKGEAPQESDFGLAKQILALAPAEPLGSWFEVSLLTRLYAPSHIVTLRGDVDGWSRDVYGTFEGGRWKFCLPRERYGARFQFKFILDGMHWMAGGNLEQDPQNWEYNESQVRFEGHTPRFQHDYDNLEVREDDVQQTIAHANYSESEMWDVIVIGSGMGGGVLADTLSDRGVRTLVLDAGGLKVPTHIYNLPNTTGTKAVENLIKQDHMENFGKGIRMNFGGRSVFWSGVIPRMQEWELQSWPQPLRDYLGENGTGYPAAEKLMRKHVTFGSLEQRLIAELSTAFPGWKVESTPMAQHQPETAPATGHLPESFIDHSTGTFSTAELLMDSLTTYGRVGRDHLYVNLNHLVTRLEHQNGRVTGVVCQDLIGNRERRYQARYVVLAAGSTESPKIAWQSDLQDPQGRIGVGFTDHPAYFFGKDDHKPYLPADSPWGGLQRHARVYLYPKSPTAAAGRRFNVEILINTEFWRLRHADDEVRQVKIDEQAGPRTTIKMKFPLAQSLVDSNWLRPGDNGGKLLANHPPLPQDTQLKAEVEAVCQQLLDFFRIQDSRPSQMGWGNNGTVHHSGGSLRLDANRQGVVNVDLKFESYDNLYAADLSVFPHIPAANPSLTLAALALRLADHLAVRLGK